jgi:hypothetical protein
MQANCGDNLQPTKAREHCTQPLPPTPAAAGSPFTRHTRTRHTRTQRGAAGTPEALLLLALAHDSEGHSAQLLQLATTGVPHPACECSPAALAAELGGTRGGGRVDSVMVLLSNMSVRLAGAALRTRVTPAPGRCG